MSYSIYKVDFFSALYFNLLNLSVRFLAEISVKHPFSLAGQLCSSQWFHNFQRPIWFPACQIIFWITKVGSNAGGPPSRVASRPDTLQSQHEHAHAHTHVSSLPPTRTHTDTRPRTHTPTYKSLFLDGEYFMAHLSECLNNRKRETER